MLFCKRRRPLPKGNPARNHLPIPLEKGDIPALLIAALITLLPAVLLVGGVFALVIWALFLR